MGSGFHLDQSDADLIRSTLSAINPKLLDDDQKILFGPLKSEFGWHLLNEWNYWEIEGITKLPREKIHKNSLNTQEVLNIALDNGRYNLRVSLSIFGLRTEVWVFVTFNQLAHDQHHQQKRERRRNSPRTYVKESSKPRPNSMLFGDPSKFKPN